MIPLTQTERENGLPTADENTRLYPVAYVEGLKAELAKLKAAQQLPTAAVNDSEPAKMRIKVEKRENISAAELENLLNQGWEKWHAEYKGNNLNVVLTRRVAFEAPPEPEQKASAEPEKSAPTIKTVGPTLIIEPGKLADIAERETQKPMISPAEPVSTPSGGEIIEPEPPATPADEPKEPEAAPTSFHEAIHAPRGTYTVEQIKAVAHAEVMAAANQAAAEVYAVDIAQIEAIRQRSVIPAAGLFLKEVNHV